ncbi:hypothetical protein ACLKA7_014696 [Drosophila subpalustris]
MFGLALWPPYHKLCSQSNTHTNTNTLCWYLVPSDMVPACLFGLFYGHNRATQPPKEPGLTVDQKQLESFNLEEKHEVKEEEGGQELLQAMQDNKKQSAETVSGEGNRTKEAGQAPPPPPPPTTRHDNNAMRKDTSV